MADSDALYNVKKNIGYAKFFLTVGKRSDAQGRLRKAVNIVEDAARTKMVMGDETRDLMSLTEEISSLWKESKDTKDPPGSSFILAMGDMVYLATPGGGMTFLDIKKDKGASTKGASTSGNNTSTPSPQTATASPQPSVASPQPATASPQPATPSPQPAAPSTGFMGGFRRRFTGGGRGTNPPATPTVTPSPATPTATPSPATPTVTPSPATPTVTSPPAKPVVTPLMSRVINSSMGALYIPEERKKNRLDSVVLVDGEEPVVSKHSVDPLNPLQIAYTLAHIGTDVNQRKDVFFGALNKFERVGRGRGPTKELTGSNVLPYYSQYFRNSCRRSKNATVSDDHPDEFVKYVLGQTNTKDNEVQRFHVMMLQTIPVRIPSVDDTTYKNESRKVVSFSFLEFVDGMSSLYVKLLCSVEGNTIGGGTKSMTQIENIGKAYGVPRVSLGAVLPAVGFYYKMGYGTKSQEFDNLMMTIFNKEKNTRDRRGDDPSGFNVLADSILVEEQNTLVNAQDKYNRDEDEDISLKIVESSDNEIYRRSVAAAILEGLRQSGVLVRTVLGFMPDSDGTNKEEFSKKLTGLVTRIASKLNSDVYGMDEVGNADIQMYKVISQ